MADGLESWDTATARRRAECGRGVHAPELSFIVTAPPDDCGTHQRLTSASESHPSRTHDRPAWPGCGAPCQHPTVAPALLRPNLR
jgi:hypothetical protein